MCAGLKKNLTFNVIFRPYVSHMLFQWDEGAILGVMGARDWIGHVRIRWLILSMGLVWWKFTSLLKGPLPQVSKRFYFYFYTTQVLNTVVYAV
jgi:hypothetical protein